MVIRVLNITPKVGALTFDQLVDDSENLIYQGNVNVDLSDSCDTNDAYCSLIYMLANLFAEEIYAKFKPFIERSGREFYFGIHYDNGRKEHGFQLIIDFDNTSMDYQSILAKFFEWDSIVYDSDLSFEDIQDVNF